MPLSPVNDGEPKILRPLFYSIKSTPFPFRVSTGEARHSHEISGDKKAAYKKVAFLLIMTYW
jgi:hypothetical protein